MSELRESLLSDFRSDEVRVCLVGNELLLLVDVWCESVSGIGAVQGASSRIASSRVELDVELRSDSRKGL